MNPEWLPITYRDFHDVPRAFVVELAGQLYFFDCPFDDARDQYPDEFRVYALPAPTKEQLAGSWSGLDKVGQFLGTLPVDAVEFDKSKRRQIKAAAVGQIRRL